MNFVLKKLRDEKLADQVLTNLMEQLNSLLILYSIINFINYTYNKYLSSMMQVLNGIPILYFDSSVLDQICSGVIFNRPFPFFFVVHPHSSSALGDHCAADNIYTPRHGSVIAKQTTFTHHGTDQ